MLNTSDTQVRNLSLRHRHANTKTGLASLQLSTDPKQLKQQIGGRSTERFKADCLEMDRIRTNSQSEKSLWTVFDTAYRPTEETKLRKGGHLSNSIHPSLSVCKALHGESS